MIKRKIAFAGFRHGHIFSLWDRVKKCPELEISGVCEEDPETRQQLIREGKITVTDDNFISMLERVPSDIIVVGDYFARMGPMVIESMKHGKHVIADKPFCTSSEDLNLIGHLVEKKHLCAGCLFDMRTWPQMAGMHELVHNGFLGKIVQIQFTAQHPLMRATRAKWYFEKGKQGGTITDIGSHAIDLIPWIVGVDFSRVISARTWNAFVPQGDCFHDAAQFMLEMENGCGVVGDVSYSAPDSIGYHHSCYWRFNFWGTKGMAEVNAYSEKILAYLQGLRTASEIALPSKVPPDPLTDFLNEIDGHPGELTTASLLKSTKFLLKIQAFADNAGEEYNLSTAKR